MRLHDFATPVIVRAEHLALVAQRKADPGRWKKLFDRPD